MRRTTKVGEGWRSLSEQKTSGPATQRSPTGRRPLARVRAIRGLRRNCAWMTVLSQRAELKILVSPLLEENVGGHGGRYATNLERK